MLAEELTDREVFDGFFVIGFFLLVVAVASQGFSARPTIPTIGIALGLFGIGFMVFARMGIPERTHLFEYSLVALLLYLALLERRDNGVHVSGPALLAIGATVVIGVVDELVQYFMPSRVFDPIDIAFNTLAAGLAVVAVAVLRWANRRFSSRRH